MTSSIKPIPTSTKRKVEAWVADTGKIPERERAGRTFDRNA